MLTRDVVIIVAVALALLITSNVQAKGNLENGEKLAYDCVQCHGRDGKGNFETPPIANLEEAVILERLRTFNNGKRDSLDDMMHLYTEDRTDQELQDLAAYWSMFKEE